MTRGWIAIAAVAAASAASAQAPDPGRVDAIWDAAVSRMNTQIDVWFEDGEFPKVVQALKIQNLLYPEDYEMATNLGWMQENIEQWDEALATYVRFKRDNPNSPDAIVPEAQFYFMKRSWPKVVSLLEPHLKDGAHPNGLRMLARSYDMQGMYKDAIRVYERLVKLHPEDGAAKANLARVKAKLGQ